MRPKIDIRPNTYIYIVLLLFFVPLKWLFAWLFAAGFHEVCHWLAVRLCDGKIYSITIGFGGAEMECGPMTNKKRLFAVLLGPLGGLFLVLFARWIPRVALCSWFLSLYNLLPLLQLDGGRALEILFGEKALVLQKAFLIAISIIAIYASVILHLGLLPLGIIAVLWLKSRNFPCKPDICKVQ